MSDTMTEGVIASWLKQVGDKIEPGDIIAEVETDKATMELENYEEGTLLYIGAEEGDAVPVNGVIAIVGEEGEDYKELLEKAKKEDQEADEEGKEDAAQEEQAEEPAKESKEDTSAAPEPAPAPAPANDDDRRIKASPLAKKMAEDKGIDLRQVQGSGDEGRIVKRDIENFTPQAAQPAEKATASAEPTFDIPKVVGEERHTDERVSQMRKTIARRLSESKNGAPHFYLTISINMDKAVAARKGLNEMSPVKISYNDMVIKAVATALRQHPKVNASWMGDTIRYHEHIHIGMAVAMEEGLIVPVIRFADNKSLSHLAAETKDLASRARNKQLQPDDYAGNTFTVSNLGMYDIEEYTAIINPPDSCIMAVGTINQKPAVIDGEIKPAHIMKVTLSCDHRSVDGALGAQFLQTFKALMEDPVRMLI